MKTIDVGVFVPVGKNGWVHSVNSPYTPGTYEHVLKVTRHAENLGFDFALSPAIWRGRKGPSEHWMVSLESITTSAALLQATDRINIWCTAHMTVFPPAVVAKMVGTLDQIGGSRVGLNLVTGSSVLDLKHVGLWNDDLDHEGRYRLGDEWIQLVKRYWADDVVNHAGEFFSAEEGTMGPKPARMPFTINAGTSDRGFRFAVENCDAAFVGFSDQPGAIAGAKRAKEIARTLNKTDFRTYGLVSLIARHGEKEAAEYKDFLDAGVDEIALADIAAGYEMNTSRGGKVDLVHKGAGDTKARPEALNMAMVGSYASLAERIAKAALEGELDGIMLIVPDYVGDLSAVARELLPEMACHGLSCRVNDAR